MKVKVEPEYLVAEMVAEIDHIVCIMVHCQDYEHFRSLPQVLSHNGILCGKTGWNSDTNRCCYQSNAQLVKREP